VSGRGFSDDPKALDQAVSLVEMELSRAEAEGITDSHRIAQAVRRVVGRWVAETDSPPTHHRGPPSTR
ncbi:hypothetical protein J7S33_22650, partial [Saccharothrix algeriensis]